MYVKIQSFSIKKTICIATCYTQDIVALLSHIEVRIYTLSLENLRHIYLHLASNFCCLIELNIVKSCLYIASVFISSILFGFHKKNI